ncbi:MAG TPA: transcriptional repressor [Acidimicrobiales bacterium]|nr:transcriptional repressor [Acidimicrobiales bacterium]
MTGRGGPRDEDLHATVAQRLRRLDQRYTPVRRQLVQVLADAHGPRSAPELIAAVGDLPQSSVYRNLADLIQAGVTRRVQATDDLARFELAEDLAGHHHHLVCTSCGEVVDVTLSRAIEQAVGRAAEEVAAAARYRPGGHRLDLLGLCERCG